MRHAGDGARVELCRGLGRGHTVLFLSQAVACVDKGFGQCDLPELEAAASYAQVSTGGDHNAATVWRWRVGTTAASSVELELGAIYVQVPAVGDHMVLSRSDGAVETCGGNDRWECDIPELRPRASYAQALAGWAHMLLLRNNGMAVACGRNLESQGDLWKSSPVRAMPMYGQEALTWCCCAAMARRLHVRAVAMASAKCRTWDRGGLCPCLSWM